MNAATPITPAEITACRRAHHAAVCEAEDLEVELATAAVPLGSDRAAVLRANDRARDLRVRIGHAWARAAELAAELNSAPAELPAPDACEVHPIQPTTLRQRLNSEPTSYAA
jgi:hypothetical protein